MKDCLWFDCDDGGDGVVVAGEEVKQWSDDAVEIVDELETAVVEIVAVDEVCMRGVVDVADVNGVNEIVVAVDLTIVVIQMRIVEMDDL